MTQLGPCIICGDTGYNLSCGGPTICPKCDCGHFDAATVEKQARVIADLRKQIAGLQRYDAESVEAAARIIHPGAFDKDAGSEHQRHEAKTKAARVLALVPPPSEAGREALDGNGAREAAEAVCDWADNNLSMYEACCEDDPVKAKEIFEAAKRLRDLLALSTDPGTVAVASGDPVSQMSHELTRANAVNKALRDARLLLEANGYTVASTNGESPNG